MFKIHINDGTSPLPDDDICYIIAKEGIFLKKKLGVMESIAPVKKISILNTVESMAKMHIPKIPAKSFASVMSFFKEVYTLHHSEAVVLLFYSTKTKKYKMIVPQQKVSRAGADYARGITIEGMQMIGTVHSHSDFSAFHSGTDSDDEKAFDGLHITIGHNGDQFVSISASIMSNGHRFIVSPLEYVEGLKLVSDTNEIKTDYHTKIYKYVDGGLVLDEEASKRHAVTTNTINKRYSIDLPANQIKHNPQWMKMVERQTYSWQGNQGYWKNLNPQHRWGPNYSSDMWGDYYAEMYGYGAQTPIGNRPGITKSIIIGNPAAPKPGELPLQKPLFDNEVPCFTCKHRDSKIIIEEDDLEEVFYECFKCRTIVKESDTIDVDTICPVCKTDDYLFEIDDESLQDKYKKSETPVIITATEAEGEFHKCAACGNTFNKVVKDALCPFCYEPVYSQEESFESQLKTDSGEMLDPILDETNAVIIDSIEQKNRAVEKIPDPELDTIPLSARIQATSQMSIKEMMKRVFSRKGTL